MVLSSSAVRIVQASGGTAQAVAETTRNATRTGIVGFIVSIYSPPAREVEHGAGGERALLAAEPRDEGGDLFDLAEASHGDLGEHEVDVRLRHLREHAGLHRRGRHAVHSYAGLRDFLAEGLGE